MRTWERFVSRLLRALGLESIRNKLLAFAVVATLIPSLSTTWLSYTHNRRSLTEKITGEQQSVSSQAARELDLWLKERLYDLRVFASSYEVTENLDRIPRVHGEPVRDAPPYRRLRDYLNSVRERFSDYEELVVVDRENRVVPTAADGGGDGAAPLPRDWRTTLRTEHAVVGTPVEDSALHKPVMITAVPIYAAGGRMIGALTAKLNLRAVQQILRRFGAGLSGDLYATAGDGTLIARAQSGIAEPMRATMAPDIAAALLRSPGTAHQYRGIDGVEVVGTLERVPRLGWAVTVETPEAEAYRQVTRLRNLTFGIVAALLLGVGLLAYLLGTLIARPLDRLTTGAALVAAGDLDVDLPVVSGGEVGSLTEVFNEMVTRLREGRQELQRLSLTDELTGAYNRRYLMETLANEVRRSRRLQHSFSVLIADIDHFKEYNDAYGHPAGDDMLRRVVRILREATREVDCVARYGGEEFVLLLPETGVDEAERTAERIRERVALEAPAGGTITLSVGAAEFPTHGDTPEAVIASADSALYQAKHDGRNRVVRAATLERRPGVAG